MFRMAALIPAAAIMAAALAALSAPPGAAARTATRAAGAAASASPTPTAPKSPTPTSSASPHPGRHPGKHPGHGGGPAGNQPAPLVPVPVTRALHPTPNCRPSTTGFAARVTKQPWAQRALAFASVWPLSRGAGVTVAVVDSGVDFTRQLAGRVTAISLVGGNQDCVGHGTSVAGIIAASDLRTQGVPFTGVAPEARILSVRVQASEKGGLPGVLAQGIRDAATLGAQVINVSIETPANKRVLAAAVKYALRKNAVIVAAGGNDEAFTSGGQVVKGPFYPASYPGVISVGAVNAGGGLASFSDRFSDVAVTAPGVNLVSTFPGGGYVTQIQGTSFSAPFVSGVAALIRSRYPHLPAAAVVRRIEATADGQTGPGTGGGMVNPLQAVTAIVPLSGVTSPPQAAPPELVPVATAPKPPDLPVAAALMITGGALAAAFAVAIGAVVIRRGRRRGWRAARAQARADDSG